METFEIYDDEAVLYQARHTVAQRLLALSLGLGAAVPLLLVRLPGGLLWPVGASLAVLAVGSWMWTDFRHLRRLVWCLKLSREQVIGYDYRRKATALPWHRVARVEITPAGLVVVGHADGSGPPPVLTVPHAFPAYVRLSHGLTDYADYHGVPVYVDGQPWQQVNVNALFRLHEVVGPLDRA